MIACPLCSGPTEVVETRSVGAGTRRRRRCAKIGLCPGRVTTLEIATETRLRPGEALIVCRKALEKLQHDIGQLTKDAT